MSDETVHVAMCIDRGFTVPLAVALASLDDASKSDSLVVHVVHPGLAELDMARITSGLSSLEVRWLPVAESSVAGAHFNESLSNASLFRLRLGELLPAGVDRVIYLDGDVIVKDSLAPLFASDLGGSVVGAVRDAGCLWAAGPMGMSWRSLGVDPAGPYFNSGVLVIDRAAWTYEEVGARALELLRGAALRWGDQDALNAVLQGRWVEQHRRWNLQTVDLTGYSLNWAIARDEVESAIADPAIVHFTGPEKPWHYGCAHPVANEWFAYLDKTSWAGWRPSPHRESKLLTAGRSAVRSLSAWRGRRGSGLPS